jgi:hypothetical protein
MKLILKDSNLGNVKNQSSQIPENKRYGFWGIVIDVHSKNNTVDVRQGGGLVLKGIPVACTDEWVCEYKDDYLAGSRNLPPINARVFVLMPTGTYEGAFVLCSGLSMYEKEHKNKFMANSDSEEYDKRKTREIVRQGNWKSKYNYNNGSYEIISPDEKTSFKIDYEDKDNPNISGKIFEDITFNIKNNKEAIFSFTDKIKTEIKADEKVSVEAFGSSIEIDKDGNIKVTGKKDNKIEIQGDINLKANSKVNIDGSVINLNGSANSSVKAEVLKIQLDKMKARIDGIINAIKSSPTTLQDGGNAYKSGMVGIVSKLVSEDFSKIIDAKVKHGS